MNRETWLENGVIAMRPWFDEKGHPLPEKILVSCGWPKARGGKARSVGQCFDPRWTVDGTAHIFICPTISEPTRVLDILLHELCHAAVGTTVGHNGPFVHLIREFGLLGKATATYCGPSTPLHEALLAIAEQLGDYPHSAMKTGRIAATRPPGGGWIKFQSVSLGSSYILRVSPKSLADHGAPRDPLGQVMVES